MARGWNSRTCPHRELACGAPTPSRKGSKPWSSVPSRQRSDASGGLGATGAAPLRRRHRELSGHGGAGAGMASLPFRSLDGGAPRGPPPSITRPSRTCGNLWLAIMVEAVRLGTIFSSEPTSCTRILPPARLSGASRGINVQTEAELHVNTTRCVWLSTASSGARRAPALASRAPRARR